jgi:hypothetical protein
MSKKNKKFENKSKLLEIVTVERTLSSKEILFSIQFNFHLTLTYAQLIIYGN